MAQKVYITYIGRTPTGIVDGQLEGISDNELATPVLKNLKEKKEITRETVGEIIFGVARQTSTPSNLGRYVALDAELPVEIPSYTVQRQSASGIQALLNGYYLVKSGNIKGAVVGGAESSSMVPLEIYNARFDFSPAKRNIVDGIEVQQYASQPESRYGRIMISDLEQSLFNKCGFTENMLKEYTENEIKKFNEKAEIVSETDTIIPISKKVKKTVVEIAEDESTGENRHLPYGDGAAVCLLSASDSGAICEVASVGISAGNPAASGKESGKAAEIALDKAGVPSAEIDTVFVSYITPSQGLLVQNELMALGVDKAKINPIGSALATGNPQGASGIINIVQAANYMNQKKLATGLVISCAEGGQTVAVVLKK